MSLMSGDGLPSSTAFAFAAEIRYCEALGPAPQSIDFCMKSGARLESGLVDVVNFTAY